MTTTESSSTTVVSIPDALQAIKDAVKARDNAEALLAQRVNELHDAMETARRSGARVASISVASGLSRQRTNMLVRHVKPIDAA